jgi:HEAT repeat protein
MLVKRTLVYDTQAVCRFLKNLSSTDSHRCKTLQETIHDLNDPLIWHHLLHYLALHRWDQQIFGGHYDNRLVTERIDQAIVEVFTQDETIDEKSIKDAVLHEALVHPEDRLQYAAAYILGMRHDSRSIPVLAEIIDQGDKKWSLRAVRALSVLKEKECAQPLMKVLVMDRSKLHREARRALQHLGSLAESVWLEALNHPDSHIRWDAAHGLGQIGDSRAAPTLAEGLLDESYVVRWATANVLAQMGKQGIPATLSVLCSHEISEPFRQAAYHALHGCTSLRARERIKQLLDALSESSSNESVSSIAQGLLVEWNKN